MQVGTIPTQQQRSVGSLDSPFLLSFVLLPSFQLVFQWKEMGTLPFAKMAFLLQKPDP